MSKQPSTSIRRFPIFLALCGFSFLLLAGFAFFEVSRLNQGKQTSQKAMVASQLKASPILFEKNQGQVDSRVDFISRKGETTFFFTPNSLTLSLSNGTVVTRNFLGANKNAKMSSQDKAEAISSYFIGNDPKQWKTKIPNYSAITYESIYPNIDLQYGNDDGQLIETFTVQPKGEVSNIGMQLDNVDGLAVTKEGELEVKTGKIAMTFKKLLAYQETGGKRQPVKVSFDIKNKNTYGFSIGEYDHTKVLIIDPTLVMSFGTYLGRSGTEYVTDTVIDGSGSIYVSGYTSSTDFPTTSPYQISNAGGDDIFISKFSADGSTLLYSTYLGGIGNDRLYGLAVDAGGNIYFAGQTTSSTDFPTLNAFQGTYGGGAYDCFVTKLNSSGSALVYSTYLGGSGDEYGGMMKVDSSGQVHFAGVTTSTDYPMMNAYQPASGGGTYDAVVTKFNSAGSALVFSTYRGGSLNELGSGGIDLDSSGNIFVGGNTQSSNFPTMNPTQVAYGGVRDAILTKYNPSGTMLFSTYLGGAASDQGGDTCVDQPTGDVYVVGRTVSTDFPVSNAYQSTFGGGTNDFFITKFNNTGSSIYWSTYLGGALGDTAAECEVDSYGNVFVSGITSSTNYPTLNAYQSANGGGTYDSGITVIKSDGTGLIWSTYLGGNGAEAPNALAVSGTSVFVGGPTSSTNFPTVSPYQGTYGGGTYDGYLVKLAYINTLTYTAGANGSITGTSTQTVDYGSSGSAVTAVPNTGYHFVDWSDASTANPRTDTNVIANISVTANFAINTYTLTYTAGANGSITGTSTQIVDYGSSGSAVTAMPNTGYHFVDWSDSSTANPRTDTNVIANISVTANFAINTYTLTYTAGANGSITGTSPQTVNYGSSGSAVTAVNNPSYHFVDWSDSSTANPRTDTNVIADISVTANFVHNGNPKTVNYGSGGSTAAAAPNASYNLNATSDITVPVPGKPVAKMSTSDLKIMSGISKYSLIMIWALN